MNVNWANLRPWKGSQEKAFEELCCQVAEYEPVPTGGHFTRKGAPDAGVECFWKLLSGEEWGWQAKFFTSLPLSSGQWSQIDDSVQKALEKHPNLARYFLCLPVNRPDARVSGQKSFLDRWNDHVLKWQRWADQKKVRVVFEYWGEHEIFQRLNREQHIGRLRFWFDKEFVSDRWFGERLNEAIANAGPRYTPKLNVDLPISRLFAGLGRTPAFYDRLREGLGVVARRHRDLVNSRYSGVLPADTLRQLNADSADIPRLDRSPGEDEFSPLPLKTAEEGCQRGIAILRDADRTLQEEEKKASSGNREGFGFMRHNLYELLRALWALQELIASDEAKLANRPALLLVGEGGTGKTHLLCDVAKRRLEQNLPTVLLLGEQFREDEPWSQVLKLVSASSENRDEFLGALDAAAQARRARALIFIDALNEGAALSSGQSTCRD